MDNVSSVHPLTPVQAGMLFHALEGRDDGAYVVQYSAVVAGPLNAARLRSAWDATVAAHGALRTAFVFEGLDEPMQVVREQVQLPWLELDWSNASPDDVSAKLQRFLAADRRRGFDLAAAPLARLTVANAGGDRHHLIWTYHHIIVDGWSSVLLLDEVWRRYMGDGQGIRNPLPSFGDFVAWSRGRRPLGEEEFWRQRLGDAPRPLAWGFVNPEHGASRTHERERIVLSVDDTRRLREFAAAHRLTLNTVVHGAWALTLARCTNSLDVVYGATVAGRPADMPDVDQVVGAFINTLPVRVRIDDAQGLVKWLATLQNELMLVRDHELSSLRDIGRWAGVPAADLFDAILVFENAPPAESQIGRAGIQLQSEEYFDQSNYGFALLAHPRHELDLHAVFRPDRIAPASAHRLLHLMADTLRSIPEHVHTPVAQLGPPMGPEWDALVGPLATPEPPPVATPDVLELFLQHARATPDAPAIITELGELSYGLLHTRARLLAARLRERGVGPGDRVGILARKSAEFVVGVLATAGCGASYVPLDPAYPTARIARMAELSRVVVLLTDDPGSAMAAELYMPVVALPDLDSQFSTTTTALPDLVAALPEYEAYVIFTSGSTGVPKGVSVSRANLAYSTAARNAVYGTQRPRFLLLSPVGFDSAVAGLFWPLTTGGAVIIPTPAIEQSPHKLAQFIHQSGATMTLCVPSFYRLLVEQADAMHLQNLETVIVAGEACPPDVVRLHFERTPDTMLFNEYGPTECTVWSTFARLLPSVHEDHVPIGRPIPGATVRVLDAAGRPVPLGIAGELYVGGPGVARGYVDLPNETTERFVDDPLLTGARLYRTGDIVRMGNDGVLTFLGRNDSQIKIRGFRIERHEIEAALQRHSEIAEVVVVPHVPRPQESERPTDDGSVEELVACLNELHPTVAAELLRSCA